MKNYQSQVKKRNTQLDSIEAIVSERVKAITAIIDKIRCSQDLSTIFKETTQELRHLLNSDRLLVYQFNPDWSGHVVAESVGSEWIHLLIESDGYRGDGTGKEQEDITEIDDYLQETQGGRYLFGQKFSVVNDIYTQGFSDCYIETLEKYQAKAYIIVPIFREEKLWGLLCTYQNENKRVWQDSETNLMVLMAHQLGIAIRQVKDAARLRQEALLKVISAKQTDAIAHILHKISSVYDIDEIFRIITQELRSTLQSDRFVVYQFNQDWSGQVVAENVGDGWVSLLNQQENHEFENVRMNLDTVNHWSTNQEQEEAIFDADTYLQETQGGRYSYGKKFSVVNDIYAQGFPDCYIAALERNQAKAYIIVPIFQDEKLWGLLGTYQNDSKRIWQESEIDLMMQVANQSAIALKQADYVERLKQQNQLALSAAERSKAIAHILYQIRNTYDIDTIFKIITQEMRQVLKSDRCLIYQFNADWSGQIVAESVGNGWSSLLARQNKNETLLKDSAQMDCDTAEDWSLEEEDDIFKVDHCLQEAKGGNYADGKKYSVVNDIYAQGFPDCYIQALEKNQARAYIIIPIFQGEQLWGLLGAYQNDGTRIWQDSEIELMMQVADQSAIALRQSDYLEKLENKSKTLEQAFEELKLTQDQLIKQEKLSALGELVAGIAHEINTPLGAIQASAGDNTKALIAAIDELPRLSDNLNAAEQDVFFQLLDSVISSKPLYSSREKRPLKRAIKEQLKGHNIDNARRIADVLIDIGIYEGVDDYLSLLQHPKVDWILELVYNLACLMGNNRTVITSVEKASKVVFALKNYARFDHSGNKQLVSIKDGLETVLEIYRNHLKSDIEVFRHYQDLPDIWCYPDELMQVWTNLIHNGIQAMEAGGQLTIATSEDDNGIMVEISDSGSGIPHDIRERIFEPFFTTKPTGEGSGLGLHICQKIIDKHQGYIVVDSKPGHTRFGIWLPISDH